MNFIDDTQHQGLRNLMVEELARAKGITDPRVLEAMRKVPRHWFADNWSPNHCYTDISLAIQCGQTISRPSTVAFQSQLLSTQPGMRVLEIGTGCGYQTAILTAMNLQVYSIERQHDLYKHTRELLQQMYVPAHLYMGDGYLGLPEEAKKAPFDRIIITCGASFVPRPLIEQLAVGGIMVIPVGDEHQHMYRITKRGPSTDQCEVENFGDCNFVPMLQGKQF